MTNQKIDCKKIEADDRTTIYTSYYKDKTDSIFITRARVLSNGSTKPDGLFSQAEFEALGNKISLKLVKPKKTKKNTKETVDSGISSSGNKQLQKQINANKKSLEEIKELILSLKE